MVKGTWNLHVDDETDVEALSLKLGLQRVTGEADWHLVRAQGTWTLTDRESRKLRIDFDQMGPDYHRKAPRGRTELLAKALGSAKGLRRAVDLTAGLGQDAVFLSQLGFEVLGIERHPVLAFLLQQAKNSTERPDLQSLRFEHCQAEDFLRRMDLVKDLEVGYYDPMYPTKKKSALPRQEMVLFRELVGVDEDSETVALLAKEVLPRLVIKRPNDAQPLLPNPQHSFLGTTVRYDIYMRS